MDSTSPSNLPSGAPATRSPKFLWGVIGALAVAVAALGGVLLHRQDAGAPPSTVAAVPAVSAVPAGSPIAPDDFKPEAMPPAPMPAAPPVTAGTAPRALAAAPAPSPGPGAAPVIAAAPVAPAPPPCAVCGHVESVRSVQKRAQNTTGVGAVAGGVVGGLVGNQFGHGNGRVATTVLGAVGGGFAGNEVEKHVRTVTVYEVAVRMDDGSLRTVETKTAPPIGKPVTLRKGLLRPADGHK